MMNRRNFLKTVTTIIPSVLLVNKVNLDSLTIPREQTIPREHIYQNCTFNESDSYDFPRVATFRFCVFNGNVKLVPGGGYSFYNCSFVNVPLQKVANAISPVD